MAKSEAKAKDKKANSKDNQEVCNLDCRKKKNEKDAEKEIFPQIHDLKGPVKLVLVDPPEDRGAERKRTSAGLIAWANIAIGANFLIIVMYSMSFFFNSTVNFHVAFCTFGFQLCLPLAILIHHPLYGAAGPLSESQRTWNHVKLLITATGCIVIGLFLTPKPAPPTSKSAIPNLTDLTRELPFIKAHNYVGITSVALCAVSLVNGMFLIFFKKGPLSKFATNHPLPRLFRLFHRSTGIFALITNSVCFIISLTSPTLQIAMFMSAGLVPTMTMVAFTLFYTFVITVVPGSAYRD